MQESEEEERRKREEEEQRRKEEEKAKSEAEQASPRVDTRSTKSLEDLARDMGKGSVDELDVNEVAGVIKKNARKLQPTPEGNYEVDGDPNKFSLTKNEKGGFDLKDIGQNTSCMIAMPSADGTKHDVVEIKNGEIVNMLDGGGGLNQEFKKKIKEQKQEREQQEQKGKEGQEQQAPKVDPAQRIVDTLVPEGSPKDSQQSASPPSTPSKGQGQSQDKGQGAGR